MQFPDYKNSFGLLAISAQWLSEGFARWCERKRDVRRLLGDTGWNELLSCERTDVRPREQRGMRVYVERPLP